MEAYAEYGAVGVIVSLFVMLILNLIKSQKAQSEDLDSIRQAIAKSETKMSNVEGIILKMLDRWNRSDETSQRHREDIVKELKDVAQTYKEASKDGKISEKEKEQLAKESMDVIMALVKLVWRF